MTDAGRPVDGASLVWAAAVVEGRTPEAVCVDVDVEALARVVAGVPRSADDVVAASAVLVGVITHRPFAAANAAAGWLAATELVARSGHRVVARPAHVLRLCERVHAGRADATEVEAALRAWLVPAGRGCPVCGRRVYVDDAPSRRVVMPGSMRFELASRCAYEHGAHDRQGRPLPVSSPAEVDIDVRQPVVARGRCGSLLIAAADGRSLVVSPSCDEPPIVRVVAVDELHAGDLVGPWDALVARSTTLGFAPAGEVDVDADDGIDLDRLERALRVDRSVELCPS